MATDPRYAKLLEPGRIGGMELRNRIIMAPMGTGYATAEGFVTQRLKDYYEERARGGAALIITGVLSVDPTGGRCESEQKSIAHDRYIPGLVELTEAIHKHGARIAAQIQHAGKIATVDVVNACQPVTASEMPAADASTAVDMNLEEIMRMAQRFSKMPKDLKTRALALEEIPRYVALFAQAAERARKCGFDGVEIHAAHGYLIYSFLSPYANRRTDQYGGELANRARFLLEIIGATREKVGPDYPVWCRIDGREWNVPGGITPADSRALAVLLQEAGVDAIHVSGYGSVPGTFIDAPIPYPPGRLVPDAWNVKQAVKIPVIAVGRISPELGEEVLRQGRADFIAMGRALLADPELPHKLAAGTRDDVRPCIRCYECASAHVEDMPTICSVNAACGREAEFRLQPAQKPRNVAVIGSGPAGMEAARIAALRGHKVTLYEKNKRLGGSLVFASVVSEDNEGLLDWMIGQVKKLPIDIKMGVEVTPQSIKAAGHDVTIVAVGPNIDAPQIPGGQLRNVMTGKDLREMMNGRDHSGKMAWWIKLGLPLVKPVLQRLKPSQAAAFTRRWMPVGKNVVVIGGDLVAVELAEFLVERGRKVTMVSTERSMAPEMSIARRWRVLGGLRQHGVIMHNKARYEKFTENGVVFSDKEKRTQTIPCDTVVIAEGIKNNPGLYQALEGQLPELYQAGDCADVRLILGAIEDGARIGMTI